METTRPTDSVTLALSDGTDVKCTIKKPVLKLVREFRKTYMVNGLKNSERSALLDKVIVQTQTLGKADDPAAAQAELDKQVEKAQQLDADAIQALIDSTKLIINVPNTHPDGGAAIDFEASDLSQIKASCDFFLASISS